MNWQTLISEIQAQGVSQVVIGQRLGRSQAWVSAVAQGKYADLRWGDGKALLALFEELKRGPVAVDSEKTAKTEAQKAAA